MSYEPIEAKIQTLIQGLAAFSDHPNWVTRGDYYVLNSGVTCACVIDPGTMVQQPGTPVRTLRGVLPNKIRDWITFVNIFVAYNGKRVASPALIALRDQAITLFDQYPTLDGLSVQVLEAVAADNPFDVYNEAGEGPFFQAQTIRLTIREVYKASGGEYA